MNTCEIVMGYRLTLAVLVLACSGVLANFSFRGPEATHTTAEESGDSGHGIIHIYNPIIFGVKHVVDRAAGTPDKRMALIKKTVEMLRLQHLGEDIHDLYYDFNVEAFMTRIAKCASRNYFLNAFIGDATSTLPYYYSEKSEEEQDRVIPRAVAYAVVLDRATRAIRNDWKLFKKLQLHYDDETSKLSWKQYVNAFEIAKKVSVDMGIRSIVGQFENNKVDPTNGKNGLPLNIVEASLEDFRLGNKGNARAGLSIAFEAPGHDHDESTGAGPTRFSDDGNAIWYFPPLPKLWADVYQTWNLAFVSHYPDAPMFYGKLANPQVMCYPKDKGQEYLFNRIISLYLHIHQQIFERTDRQSKQPDMHWNNQEITTLWSDHNEFIGDLYVNELDDRNPNRGGRVRTLLKKMLSSMAKATGATLGGMQKLISSLTSSGKDIDDISPEDIEKESKSFGDIVSEMISYLFG